MELFIELFIAFYVNINMHSHYVLYFKIQSFCGAVVLLHSDVSSLPCTLEAERY